MLPFQLHPVGDCALLAEFAQRIAPDIGAAVAALNSRVLTAKLPGVVETVPAFASLLITYDPLVTEYDTIADAVQKVCSGDVDLDRVSALDTAAARKELLKIKGVGPKVADCTMLFSMKKSDAFPIDVWVQRTMRTLYCGEGANLNMIQAKAAQIFGEYAGIAQQYLFYYARENAMKR